MRDRRERILKHSCLVLGAFLAAQLTRFILGGDPAKGLVIPALPTLPQTVGTSTNNTAANSVAGTGTNTAQSQVSSKGGTNQSNQTNSTAIAAGNKSGGATNAANSVSAIGSVPSQTNALLTALTNGSKGIGSNTAAEQHLIALASNSLVLTNSGSTNQTTNATRIAAGAKTGTNSTSSITSKTNSMPPGRMAMGGMPMGMPGGKPPELPPEIKERVDRIVQGEILGQVLRPMPMALLGIAGPNAFLRSSDGQSGMIKEGDKLGNLKLLRIGNNRVLVEEEGEKKELSIFAGLGSESLMPAKEPPAKENKPNEPTTRKP